MNKETNNYTAQQFKEDWAKFTSSFRCKSLSKLLIILSIVSVLIIAFAIYIGLTPFNLANGGFRFLIILMLLLWSTPLLFKYRVQPKIKSMKGFRIPVFVAIGLVVIIITTSIIVSPLFIANKYRDLITIDESGVFSQEIENYTDMQIPVVDRDLATKLGDKKLGEGNYGSQFCIGHYTMIAVNDKLEWVAPIEYQGFFQWLDKPNSPGYVRISATDPSDVTIVTQELKYVNSAYFGSDLERKIYFSKMDAYREYNYPHLELDDNGKPYYVQSILKKNFALVSGTDTVGAIITDALSGESSYYPVDEVPSWVDKVHPTYILLDQLNYWGKYVNGYWNTVFAKADMLQTSEGYSFIYNNGEMYLYTGMTSIASDESIVGAVMVNVRTKQTNFYSVAGATEYASSQSALGQRQEKRYTTSFPILINFDGVPTYFMTLKDDEGLIKEYAYVNVNDYTKLAVVAENTQGTGMQQAQSAYAEVMGIESAVEQLTLTIKDIGNVVVNDTMFLKFDKPTAKPADWTDEYYNNFDKLIFTAPLSMDYNLAFANIGDSVQVEFVLGNTALTQVKVN